MALPSYLSSELFRKWFPSKHSCSALPMPRLRIICLAGAGMEQLVFVSKGTARSPMANPLLTFCQENNIQLLSAQLPGRSQRYKEDKLHSAQEVAQAMFNVLKPLLVKAEDLHRWEGGKIPVDEEQEIGRLNRKQSSIPYVLVGHSMAGFCLYEFLLILQKQQQQQAAAAVDSSSLLLLKKGVVGGGALLPKKLLLTCCVSPDYPPCQRPWSKSEGMSDTQLREEARGWDVNEEVFKVDLWGIYGNLFRADFPIFDRYVMSAAAEGKENDERTEGRTQTTSGGGLFVEHAVCWIASHDKRIKRDMMLGWQALLFPEKKNGEFELREIEGANHAFLYDAEKRESWMKEVVEIIRKI
eukprot:GHVS01080570.1.p1 GENE.GHVS01080570.1~~GHVS01080570.1.p1  ORF type:complete len:355 (+),score=75.82 GHVS01080570.1:1086-2150(+)